MAQNTFQGDAFQGDGFQSLNNAHAQAQADILVTYNAHAQAQVVVTYVYVTHLTFEVLRSTDAPPASTTQLAFEVLRSTDNPPASVTQLAFQVLINRAFHTQFAQAQADIVSSTTPTYAFAQAQGQILSTTNVFAQAQSSILTVSSNFAQAQSDILQIYQGYGQAQCLVGQRYNAHSQAQAWIEQTYFAFAQSQVSIKSVDTKWAQANADIKQTYQAYSQAQAGIANISSVHAQAQCLIFGANNAFAQSQTSIKATDNAFAQAQCYIPEECEIVFNDTFTRSESADFGTPDLGVYTEPAPGLFAPVEEGFTTIDGSKLILSGTNDYDFLLAYPEPVSPVSGDFEYQIDFLPTQSAFATYVEIDAFDADYFSNFKNFFNYIYDDGLGTTYLNSFYAGVYLGPEVVLEYGEWHTLKIGRVGDTAYAVVWKTSDPEPAPQVEHISIEAWDPAIFDFYADIGEGHEDQLFDNINICTTPQEEHIYAHSQAQCFVLTSTKQHAQAQCSIKRTNRSHGNAQAKINAFNVNKHAQAQARIDRGDRFAQAQCDVVRSDQYGWAQATTTIALRSHKFAQAQGTIKAFRINKHAQALAQIKAFNIEGFAQAQALINSEHKQAHAQAQCRVSVTQGYAQAQCLIKNRFKFGQAQAMIERLWIRHGQAQALIKYPYQGYAQANALIINGHKHAQAQCRVRRADNQVYAQANAQIRRSIAYAQAQCFIEGGRYLVRFNQHVLPGYAQSEDFTSGMRIEDKYAPYDKSLSQYMGLENKEIAMTLKVFDAPYAELKEQVQLAGTMLRSTKSWAKLYIQKSDRHYLAITKQVKIEQEARQRDVDYTVTWEAQPWLISDQVYTVSGTGLITVTRTLDDGGWTPATVKISGTNITVSGYTDYEAITGLIVVSGAVSNLTVTTQPFTATINGQNIPHYSINADYSMYIGPGTTYIDVDGATDCIITYNNRWYL